MTCVDPIARKLGAIASPIVFLAAISPAQAAGTNYHDVLNAKPPSVSTGSCMESTIGYSVATGLVTTSRTSYADVPGTAMSFTQGSTGCVEVSFSAEGVTSPGEILITRMVLDGSTVCIPGDNLFASDSPSGDPADHAMNYICTGVSSGSHSIKVQFRSRFGTKVGVDFRTTIVRYAP